MNRSIDDPEREKKSQANVTGELGVNSTCPTRIFELPGFPFRANQSSCGGRQQLQASASPDLRVKGAS